MIYLNENTIEEGAMSLNCGENTILHLNIAEGKLSAVVEKDDVNFCVKPEYMKAFNKITNTGCLSKFFQNAFVKINQLSNGDFKFDVNQKAHGGGGAGSKDGDGKKAAEKEVVNVLRDRETGKLTEKIISGECKIEKVWEVKICFAP